MSISKQLANIFLATSVFSLIFLIVPQKIIAQCVGGGMAFVGGGSSCDPPSGLCLGEPLGGEGIVACRRHNGRCERPQSVAIHTCKIEVGPFGAKCVDTGQKEGDWTTEGCSGTPVGGDGSPPPPKSCAPEGQNIFDSRYNGSC
ncbi:hypothetical protein HYT33_01805 [Candidatus Roizmanbacteria bacterium]|nr:hypothetical protein [Candidatus Roizmanbacteria bacterium]